MKILDKIKLFFLKRKAAKSTGKEFTLSPQPATLNPGPLSQKIRHLRRIARLQDSISREKDLAKAESFNVELQRRLLELAALGIKVPSTPTKCHELADALEGITNGD